jgi:hypothetical protein
MGEGGCDLVFDFRHTFGGGGMGCSTCIWVLGLFVRTACRCDLGHPARIPKIEGGTGMTNTDTSKAKADDWVAWLDDTPIKIEFHAAIESLQGFISDIAAERDAAIARAEKAEARVSELEGALLDRITNIGVAWSDSFENQLDQAKNIARAALSREGGE